MTGIAGFHDWKRDTHEQRETLLKMTEVLSHRRIGSDETLEYVDANLALTTGLLWTAEAVTVAVDGYLYNHEELRQQLLSIGHRLQSHNLAELLQTAYLQWGDAFVERLSGAFAVVVWDSRQQKLLLGRDHLGVKPLFYAAADGAIPFGSEIKAVLEYPLVTRVVDAVGLSEMLLKGPFYTPGQAVFRDVQEVRPGHLVIFTPAGQKTVCYWQVESGHHEDSAEETAAKLGEMLGNHVTELHQQGLADTSILSGGLDSSGLIGLLCRTVGTEYKTHSGNTPESMVGNIEERDAPWAKRVAEYLGIENQEVLAEFSSIMESIDQPRRACDLPTIAQYEATVYTVFRKIRERGYHSVMVGEAADELFGSLGWFYDPDVLNKATFPWNNAYTSSLLSPEVLRATRAEEYMADIYHDALRRVPRFAEDTPEEARVRECLYLSTTDYLTTILRRNDRLAASLRMNVSIPFCEPRLVQYIWNIPWEMKNYAGRQKGVLREAFRSVLPDDVVYRKKGTAPIVFNETYIDYLKQEYETLLHDPQAPIYSLVDREKILASITSDDVYQDRYVRFRFDYYVQVDRWIREMKAVLL